MSDSEALNEQMQNVPEFESIERQMSYLANIIAMLWGTRNGGNYPECRIVGTGNGDIEELERLLADDPVPVPIPRVFDEPLGHSDSISRSFNEFEDISSLDPPESTLVIDVSFLPVPPLLDPKQTCLRDVERFDPFFSLTQSVEYDVGDGETFIVISIWPSPRPAAIYSPKVAMYCYYPPHSLRVMVRPWS
ncbi:hypothetical protein Tco_0551094 [Tanacetum coccineum]